MDNDWLIQYPHIIQMLETNRSYNKFSMPSCYWSCEQITNTNCCPNYCCKMLSCYQISDCRQKFIVHCQDHAKSSKKQQRHSFVHKKNDPFPKRNDELDLCDVIKSRILGVSYAVYGEMLTADYPNDHVSTRTIYSKTIENVGIALAEVKAVCDSRPTGGKMMPPGFRFQNKSLLKYSTGCILRKVRTHTDTPIYMRKADRLQRCGICQLFKRARDSIPSMRTEINDALRAHLRHIKKERCIVSALENYAIMEESEFVVFNMDSSSSNQTKLPSTSGRSKNLPDAALLNCELTACEIYESSDPTTLFVDYISMQSRYIKNSSFYVSIFLDSLRKLSQMPHHIILGLDNAPYNKSNVFIAGMSCLMKMIPTLNRISLIYRSVGHTHDQADAHFGQISNVMRINDVHSPSEFAEIIRGLKNVREVNAEPTIFSFEHLLPHVIKYKNRATCRQIMLVKQQGQVLWGAAARISSDVMFRLAENSDFVPVFRVSMTELEEPTIVKPNKTKSSENCFDTFLLARAEISKSERADFLDWANLEPSEGFAAVRSSIQAIPQSTMMEDDKMTEATVAEFAKSLGGKVPPEPVAPTLL